MHRKLQSLGCIVLLACSFIACQPEPELVLVPDNTAPPDLSVAEVIKENYVNKLYITLLGRKPSPSESLGGVAILSLDNSSMESRETLINSVLQNPEYAQRTFDIARSELLLNVDTSEISLRILIYTDLLTQPEYEPFYDLLVMEIGRLQALKDVPGGLLNGTISRIEMHRRMIDNNIYDEINMGSQNFVLSVFESFLGRYPTDDELARSIAMVDGLYTVLFGKEGESKDDFIGIFMDSDDYYEGEVINIFRDFLFRSPNSQEMAIHTIAYRQHQDFHQLLVSILSSDEYLGI